MKRVVALLVLNLVASPAICADWQIINGGKTRIDYVDAASVVQKGKFVRSWIRTSFANSQSFKGFPANGALYKSNTQLALFDCSEREMYTVSATYFSEDAWDGTIIASENPRPNEKPQFAPVAPDTVGEAMMEYSCETVKKGKRQ